MLRETAISYLTDDEFLRLYRDSEELSDLAVEGMRRLQRARYEIKEIKEWMERMPNVDA